MRKKINTFLLLLLSSTVACNCNEADIAEPLDEDHHTSSSEEDDMPPGGFIQPRKPYLGFTPFTIPILNNANPYKTVHVRFTLKLQEKGWPIARVYSPYIYHALFKDLYYALNLFWRGDQAPSADILKKRLMNAYQLSFGDRWPIKDVYVHDVVIEKD